jgi:hypothetical protein
MSILAAYKKRKWTLTPTPTPKVYDFHTFADAGYPKGAFRDNMPLFLQQYAQRSQPHQKNVGCMPVAWLTLLGHSSSTEDFVVPLYTIVEDVSCTQCPYCDHCRSAGN